jgi:hypothetical protein
MENLPLEEYKDVSNNVRHYAVHSVARMSLFIAFTGGLLSVLFGLKGQLSAFAYVAFEFLGLVLTVLFWVATFSSYFLWGRFIQRAVELESSLGFKQYGNLPGAPHFCIWSRPSFLAMNAIFGISAILWFLFLVGSALRCVHCLFCHQ